MLGAIPGPALNIPGLPLRMPGLSLRTPGLAPDKGAEPSDVTDVDGSNVCEEDASGVPLSLKLAPPEAILGALESRRWVSGMGLEGIFGCCCSVDSGVESKGFDICEDCDGCGL